MNLNQLIEFALQEDMPNGDLTTDSLNMKSHPGEAHLIAKEDLLLSGIDAFDRTIKRLDDDAKIQWNFKEGELVLKAQIIAVIEGNLLQVLKAERTALNFIGHLSGIATLTGCYVKTLEGTNTKILDTRKTIPGYRELEKRAVTHGGGHNHRMNLSHAIMIKENHIQVAGGIKQAVEKIRSQTTKEIELEVKNLEEVRLAVNLRVNRILLDNMSLEAMKKALSIIPSTIESEASGNMTLDKIRAVAELGVDYISVGALTHSAPCADISLLFYWNTEEDDGNDF